MGGAYLLAFGNEGIALHGIGRLLRNHPKLVQLAHAFIRCGDESFIAFDQRLGLVGALATREEHTQSDFDTNRSKEVGLL